MSYWPSYYYPYSWRYYHIHTDIHMLILSTPVSPLRVKSQLQGWEDLDLRLNWQLIVPWGDPELKHKLLHQELQLKVPSEDPELRLTLLLKVHWGDQELRRNLLFQEQELKVHWGDPKSSQKFKLKLHWGDPELRQNCQHLAGLLRTKIGGEGWRLMWKGFWPNIEPWSWTLLIILLV